ncbi:MAG TPA: YfiR family protein [Gammaproteobacteria bacterium]|nr:YfiR family protein [Gammaproteobacteria bacterium]
MKSELRRATTCLVLVLCTLFWTQGPVAAPATAYADSEVKAAFLYRFAGYVEWPPAAMQAPRFVIAVLGADAVAASLERALTTIRIKGRPGEVRRIDNIRDARQAHIVYIGAMHAEELDALLPQLANRPVLVVTDGERGLDAGGMLNFRTVDKRVRFEVAPETAEQAGLSISADLLAVAMQVRRRDLRSDEMCAPLLHAQWMGCSGGDPIVRLSRLGRRLRGAAWSRRLWTPPA